MMVTQLKSDILDQSGVSACFIVYYYFCYVKGVTLYCLKFPFLQIFFSYDFIFQQVI